MALLGLPYFAWLGIFLFILLVAQVGLGIAMTKGKPVLKYHKIVGLAILGLAIVHLIFGLLFMLKGIVW